MMTSTNYGRQSDAAFLRALAVKGFSLNDLGRARLRRMADAMEIVQSEKAVSTTPPKPAALRARVFLSDEDLATALAEPSVSRDLRKVGAQRLRDLAAARDKLRGLLDRAIVYVRATADALPARNEAYDLEADIKAALAADAVAPEGGA